MPRNNTENGRRYRARRRGELPPFPWVSPDLFANATTGDGCWEWQRAQHSDGYGVVRRNGGVEYVHRISLELRLGRSLGPGMQACHACDNRLCIRPNHLFEGTVADNNRDMRNKGRARAWGHPVHRTEAA